jgi:hypothetical protein
MWKVECVECIFCLTTQLAAILMTWLARQWSKKRKELNCCLCRLVMRTHSSSLEQIPLHLWLQFSSIKLNYFRESKRSLDIWESREWSRGLWWARSSTQVISRMRGNEWGWKYVEKRIRVHIKEYFQRSRLKLLNFLMSGQKMHLHTQRDMTSR